jgi:hypothetical protein
MLCILLAILSLSLSSGGCNLPCYTLSCAIAIIVCVTAGSLLSGLHDQSLEFNGRLGFSLSALVLVLSDIIIMPDCVIRSILMF